jgi:outer membrane protein assembly factor BamB
LGTRSILARLLSVVICLCSAAAAPAGESWATYRGNPQRTGNTDGIAGPAGPKILWVYRARDHFIASPVPDGDRLFASGLGPFNVATFYCLAADAKAPKRVLWTKTTPSLKLPTVSSPAVTGGRLIFGDGMHQTDDAVLHCLGADRGAPLWQLPVLGKLVHLEGSPTVAGGRVYIGGGAAGVLCVDPDRVTLNGKEQSLTAVRKALDRKWKQLLARYEAEKKKDPDFAVPPREDDLPKPAPRRVWQRGRARWHVDAPVAVVGGRVLAASAYLDREKLGDRALYCLDARTGKEVWKTPLRLNPWGGPSVAGAVVVVGGSTIGYDPKALAGARGEVAALTLADGKVRWRKAVPGGIVSCVALADGAAVATATDGKVRAFELRGGLRRWVYDAGAPFFAPPAVAGGVVYAADLKGVVHAIGLKDGRGRWTLDLGSAAEVKAPGMVYAGPVVHGGRLYVATCNLEGPHAQQPTAVACIGPR